MSLERALILELLLGEGCDCEPHISVNVPHGDECLRYEHEHTAVCAFAVGRNLCPGDLVVGTVKLS